jgi:hypothetical protein
MSEFLLVILIVGVAFFFIKQRIPDIIGRWLIPIFRKKKMEIDKKIQDIDLKAVKSDIEIQFDQAKIVLSRIKNLRYDTGKSIDNLKAEIKKLKLAVETSTNNQLPTESFNKRVQDAEILLTQLQNQFLDLSAQEENFTTIIGKLNMDGLLTTSELDNLKKDIAQSTEYVNNIASQFPK